MSYATLRMVHLGWRVIRVEPTPVAGRASHGDPNRSIGRAFAGADRHSYFVGPNVGKEAIALDLKVPEGRAALHRLLVALDVDVFCTNTMPSRHVKLGVDDASLRAVRPDLVWCCISALGLAYPDVPGYDPVLQALCGFMDLTGDPDGPPMQCGPPFIDLKAGDEAFTQVILALWERDHTGKGRAIDISMARSAASWLQTFLPMLDMGSPASELKRSGNQHRQFIPVNAYPTADGYIYVAVGSDAQWERLVASAPFHPLAQERFRNNEGRRTHKTVLHAAIAAITAEHSAAALAAVLHRAAIPNAPISAIEEVRDLPFVQASLTHTTAPDGRVVRLPPAAVDTEFLNTHNSELPFAPAYGEHSRALLSEAGFSAAEVDDLISRGVTC